MAVSPSLCFFCPRQKPWFYQGFPGVCDNRVALFFLPTPETLVLPRVSTDSGSPFFLPTITVNGPIILRSFHVICTKKRLRTKKRPGRRLDRAGFE